MKPNTVATRIGTVCAPYFTFTLPLLTRCGLCRGWCFCESSVSNLVKDFDFVLDLAKFDEAWRIWMTSLKDAPQRAAAERPSLRRTFRPRRSRAQRRTGRRKESAAKEFDEAWEATRLVCRLQWTDADVESSAGRSRPAAGEAQGTRPHHNQIGDAGVAALAEAAGKLRLKILNLMTTPTSPSKPGRPQGRPAQL